MARRDSSSENLTSVCHSVALGIRTSCRAAQQGPGNIFIHLASLLGRATAQESIRKAQPHQTIQRSNPKADQPTNTCPVSPAPGATDVAE